MLTSKNKPTLLKRVYNKVTELQHSSLGILGTGLLGFVFVIFEPELLKAAATIVLIGLCFIFFDLLEVLIEEAVVSLKNRKSS